MSDRGPSLSREPEVEPRRIYVAEIQQAVCQAAGVPMIEMVSERRARAVARPRQIAMFLACELTPLSLKQIGRHFGGRDHTTVLHARRLIADMAAVDADLAALLDRLRARLLADPNQLLLPLAAE